MGDEKEAKLSIKLLVDTNANKVLFAEASKEFVDFLFHMMSLPVGTVVKLLGVKHMVGSFGDLYKSVEALNSDFMQPNVCKDIVLKSSGISTICHPLLLLKDATSSSAANTSTKEFYQCCTYVSDSTGAVCPGCNGEMSYLLNYVAPKVDNMASSSSSGDGGYVKGVVTYMVMDNLEVKPMSTISALTLISKFHVKDVTSLVEKQLQVGFIEGIAILKASLETRAVLTSVFLAKNI